jgi:hypothetical protein
MCSQGGHYPNNYYIHHEAEIWVTSSGLVFPLSFGQTCNKVCHRCPVTQFDNSSRYKSLKNGKICYFNNHYFQFLPLNSSLFFWSLRKDGSGVSVLVLYGSIHTQKVHYCTCWYSEQLTRLKVFYRWSNCETGAQQVKAVGTLDVVNWVKEAVMWIYHFVDKKRVIGCEDLVFRCNTLTVLHFLLDQPIETFPIFDAPLCQK